MQKKGCKPQPGAIEPVKTGKHMFILREVRLSVWLRPTHATKRMPGNLPGIYAYSAEVLKASQAEAVMET